MKQRALQTFKECVRKMSSSLIDKRKSPLTDLIRFLLLFLLRNLFQIFLHCDVSPSSLRSSFHAKGFRVSTLGTTHLFYIFEIFQESPALLKSVKDAYGVNCFEEECLVELKKELSIRLAEGISSFVEKKHISCSNHFWFLGWQRQCSGNGHHLPVFPSCSRWHLPSHFQGPVSLCPSLLPTLSYMSRDSRTLPDLWASAQWGRRSWTEVAASRYQGNILFRLEAIKFIETQLPASISSAFRVLPRAVEDPDFDVRLTMLRICPSLLNHENFAFDTKSVLEEWLHVSS